MALNRFTHLPLSEIDARLSILVSKLLVKHKANYIEGITDNPERRDQLIKLNLDRADLTTFGYDDETAAEIMTEIGYQLKETVKASYSKLRPISTIRSLTHNEMDETLGISASNPYDAETRAAAKEKLKIFQLKQEKRNAERSKYNVAMQQVSSLGIHVVDDNTETFKRPSELNLKAKFTAVATAIADEAPVIEKKVEEVVKDLGAASSTGFFSRLFRNKKVQQDAAKLEQLVEKAVPAIGLAAEIVRDVVNAETDSPVVVRRRR